MISRLICALGMVLFLACGRGVPPEPPVVGSEKSPAPEELQVRKGEWFSVNQEEEAYLAGKQINRQAHERPRHEGEIVATVPVLPDVEEPRFAVVEAVISDRGRVARARTLEKDGFPDLQIEGLDQFLVDALVEVEFTPARMDGEPISVYYNLTVVLR